MDNELLQKIRSSYLTGKLELDDLLEHPEDMVREWLDIAKKSNVAEPTAMTLATVNEQGQPSARIVLLKEIDDEGFIFYTNYKSRKAEDIHANNKGALLLYWQPLERQIRIEGSIEKITPERSRTYFQSRPKGSQIGAWASRQSAVINDRSVLNDRVLELSDVYKDQPSLPLPSFWGGYRLLPNYFEFWQGRENRLHDRFEFRKATNGWTINRLAP